jgi:hypothetical protein
MSNVSVMLLVLAAFILGGVVAFFAYRTYREREAGRIRTHFGPEYERLAGERGVQAAERELVQREKRAASFTIRPLTVEDRHGFETRWQDVQKEFVDDPKQSLAHADQLLGEVMSARGYPVKDFDQRAADLSVEHPIVVQHYRAAHGIALRHREGRTTTEDLRQAMIHYRALFEELVSEPPTHAHAAE